MPNTYGSVALDVDKRGFVHDRQLSKSYRPVPRASSGYTGTSEGSQGNSSWPALPSPPPHVLSLSTREATSAKRPWTAAPRHRNPSKQVELPQRGRVRRRGHQPISPGIPTRASASTGADTSIYQPPTRGMPTIAQGIGPHDQPTAPLVPSVVEVLCCPCSPAWCMLSIDWRS